MARISTYEDLRARVDERGGITTVDLRDLTRCEGRDRASEGMMREVHNHLGDQGLAALDELRPSADLRIRIYRTDSTIGRIVRAVQGHPTRGNNMVLRDAAPDRRLKVFYNELQGLMQEYEGDAPKRKRLPPRKRGRARR